jgi:hypothetical protein
MTKAKQIICVDDSGDVGYKFNRGSSRYFIMACVIFDDPIDAEFAAASIKVLKKTMGWRQSHEFKFNKNRREDKIRFLTEAVAWNFKIRAIVIDKTQTSVRDINANKHDFYIIALKELFLHFEDRLDGANIYLDGDNVKNIEQVVTVELRHALNSKSRMMYKFRLVDSQDNVLIQFADIIAGSINRSFQEDKTDSGDYLPIVSSHIEDIWMYEK